MKAQAIGSDLGILIVKDDIESHTMVPSMTDEWNALGSLNASRDKFCHFYNQNCDLEDNSFERYPSRSEKEDFGISSPSVP
jgi:hypothetical protein